MTQRIRRAAAAGAIVTAALLAGGAPVASAEVRLSFKAARPVRVVTTPDSQYASGETVWLSCQRGATPLMVRYEGVRAPVSIIYANNLVSSKQLGIAIRRGPATSVFRSQALCATGVRVQVKEVTARSVSCSARQLAIGVPIDSGAYPLAPISSVPDGTRGWRITGGGQYERAKVICVPASAFGSVAIVTKRASFKSGAATTTISAQCRGGRRPIAWGYEAGVLEQNAWSSSTARMTGPFIIASKPQGRSGWALTFATPDGKPAVGTTDLGIAVTCAVPR